MADKPEKPELGASGADVTAAVARSVISIVPVVGQALQEVVTALVPNQRTERFEKYLAFLAEEVDRLKVSVDELKTPGNIDLIEDGAYLAVRALTDERKRKIAKAVANGIAGNDQAKMHQKRILSILGELDDEEIMLLASHIHAHRGLLKNRPKPIIPGAAIPMHEVERAAFFDWSLEKLKRLSLIETRQMSGRDSASYVTTIGRAVLRAVDLLPAAHES